MPPASPLAPAFTPLPAALVVTASHGFTGLRPAAGPLAVGIAGDRIQWVASPDDVGGSRCPVTPDAARVDYGDAFLMPGFHDAHLHFFHSALYSSPLAERFLGTSEQDCVARLAPLAARRPAGSWLLAQGWREYRWDPPVMPTRASLDAAYPDRPVALYSGDAHTLWLNSCALRRLGITEQSRPPAGGSYDRDAQGRLTGIVREAAAMDLMPRIVASFSDDELLDAYRSFQAHLNAQGVTAVCDMALMALPGLDFVRDDLFAALERARQLTVRPTLFPTLLPGTTRLRDLRSRLDGPLVRAGGYKQFLDGVSSQHTAWLRDPYANARFADDRGRPTVDPAELTRLVADAVAQGDGVRIHTIGDEAIHVALDAYEQALSARETQAQEKEGEGEAPRGQGAPSEAGLSPVLTLEHLENFQPADIGRLARLGVVASVQPRHMTLDPGGPERDLGPDRVPYMWPLRQLLDAGATLAFGTDAPVTATDPLAAVYTAVTRRDADTGLPEGGWLAAEALTVAEALTAYTAGSARAAGRGDELGTLAPGMLADLVVLDRDLLAVTPDDLLGARVLATYVGGRLVHAAFA
ncbi:MAG: amidohydrolase [Eggerthellaceae bacterium]|nr:amidohydrolase [Eggerthellaceae bacterium]